MPNKIHVWRMEGFTYTTTIPILAYKFNKSKTNMVVYCQNYYDEAIFNRIFAGRKSEGTKVLEDMLLE